MGFNGRGKCCRHRQCTFDCPSPPPPGCRRNEECLFNGRGKCCRHRQCTFDCPPPPTLPPWPTPSPPWPTPPTLPPWPTPSPPFPTPPTLPPWPTPSPPGICWNNRQCPPGTCCRL